MRGGRSPDGLDGRGMAWLTCTSCGKRGYLAKADAKRAIRRMKGRDGHMSAYRCPDNPDIWHTGHHSHGYSRQAFRDRRG